MGAILFVGKAVGAQLFFGKAQGAYNEPTDFSISGDPIVGDGGIGLNILVLTPTPGHDSVMHFQAEGISFDEYAEALTKSINGVVDLRPIQKRNLAKRSESLCLE
jgi:hypothetical protein